MIVGLCCDSSMQKLVFLSLLALCSAELGYNYGPHTHGYGTALNSLGTVYGTGGPQDDHADYHKHFYAFEAPRDSVDEAELAEQKISAVSRKNLHVVFIKAPENKAVEGTLNALAKQSSQDKTAIYVLNKQTDPHDLATKLSTLQSLHKHKPEVNFVKYRTEEEAQQAQLHIQAQYGGASEQSLQALQRQPLGYSQATEIPPQTYHTSNQQLGPVTPPGYYSPELSALPPAPRPTYLPPMTNYGGLQQSYISDTDQGQLDLPPLPLAVQQLGPSVYDLDARSARSRSIDFRVNERHRSASRMVFPTEQPSNSYLPAISSGYSPPQKHRRHAHF